MSQLIQASNSILDQLSGAVSQLTDEQFVKPSAILSGSSVGQHLRHTLEFFVCLEQGHQTGVINYDKRAHDRMIERDKELALEVIKRIRVFINTETTDLPLKLEVGYDLGSDENIWVSTNYFRELTYNIEHAVHHMAIMKIGIREVAENVNLPSDFGVAASTIRYRQETMVEH
ncbi:MAG: DinB family protein [Cyclobacteriaceae bacterium]